MKKLLLATTLLWGFASTPIYADVVLGGQNWSFAASIT